MTQNDIEALILGLGWQRSQGDVPDDVDLRWLESKKNPEATRKAKIAFTERLKRRVERDRYAGPKDPAPISGLLENFA